MHKHSQENKLLNKAVIEHEQHNRSRVLSGYPYKMVIDASDVCSLHCVFCPTGQGRRKASASMLSLPNFKIILDKLGNHLLNIDFFNWGEPLLNKDIYRLVRHAKTYGITCAISTNFNTFEKTGPRDMVLSGLDFLDISLDGVNQESYEKYRVGGDFNKVIENIKSLVKTKKEMRSQKPYIRWNYIVFKHNEKFIKQAEQMSKTLQVDQIVFKTAWIYSIEELYSEWLPENKVYSRYVVQRKNNAPSKILYAPTADFCRDPWRTIVMDASGNVFPCCGDIDKRQNFGNILADPFDSIWNGARYRSARNFISTGKVSGGVKVPCCSCLDVKHEKTAFKK
jgi:radical SAM protein with 4Fe4S-binding SPASM domain